MGSFLRNGILDEILRSEDSDQRHQTGLRCPRWCEIAGCTYHFVGFMHSGSYNNEPGHEKMSYAICEQQRRRSACASAQSDQRLCCSLARQNDTFSLYSRNFKILASLCSWAGQFVSYLVGDSQRHIFSWRGSNRNNPTPIKWQIDFPNL